MSAAGHPHLDMARVRIPQYDPLYQFIVLLTDRAF